MRKRQLKKNLKNVNNWSRYTKRLKRKKILRSFTSFSKEEVSNIMNGEIGHIESCTIISCTPSEHREIHKRGFYDRRDRALRTFC
jgi:hypothetical protein